MNKAIFRDRKDVIWQYYALAIVNYVISVFCLFEESAWYDFLILLGTSSFIAFIEWVFTILFPRRVSRVLFYLLFTLYIIGILIQFYLEYQFNQRFSLSTYLLLYNTHIDEIKNFLLAYISAPLILYIVLAFILLAFIITKASKLLGGLGKKMVISGTCVAFIGGCFMLFCGLSLKISSNAYGITKYSIFTSLASYVTTVSHERAEMARLEETGTRIEGVKTKWQDKPDVVLVIGESCSVYHSSLYGYEKNTFPNLARWRDDGHLFVFNDAVSITDFTLTAMESIYSLEEYKAGNFYNYTLFPYVFKKAGYKRFLFDNQYFIGEENTFMADLKLSDSMFNERNKQRCQYDGDMITELVVNNAPSLYIIHLYGQHYTYSERYPKEQQEFRADQYDVNRWDKSQREIIAHYDNATRYFDSVCGQVIEKFSSKNCCIVFLSDHGEEVYDVDGFMGHGTTMTTKDKNYQLRVPMAVFYSDEYQKLHPEIVENTKKSLNKKVLTDDAAQLLLELGGIDHPLFAPERSVINNAYREKHRVVMGSIDFDN